MKNHPLLSTLVTGTAIMLASCGRTSAGIPAASEGDEQTKEGWWSPECRELDYGALLYNTDDKSTPYDQARARWQQYVFEHGATISADTCRRALDELKHLQPGTVVTPDAGKAAGHKGISPVR